MCRVLVIAFAVGLAVVRPAPAQEKERAFLPGVERILFLGDSITYDGRYVAYFDTLCRLHLRDRKLDIVACGLPSETVSGLSEEGHAGGKFPRPGVHERLARVLTKLRPNLVIACYGMNDGIYLPFSQERFAKFQEGMTRLHDEVEKAGAKIIHLTPPVFDPEPIRKRVAPADQVTADRPFADYDDVLGRYAQWLIGKRAGGWQVIDLHGPMLAALARERRTNPKFTFAPDGVHPNLAGQVFLGQTLVAGLAAPFTAAAPTSEEIDKAATMPAKLFKLVHQRQRLLTDAWLTDIGHKRPMPAGLPLAQAQAKAAALERQIGELLK